MSPATTENPVLRISSVSRTYEEGELRVHALRDVSLEIPRQLFTMIVGPSGSGKSTLLNIIGCIDRASSGSVVINGTDLSSLNDTQLTRFRADHIGFIFQGFNLMPVLSVFENVEYALVLAGAPKRERELATEKILRDVHLYDQRHQRPNQTRLSNYSCSDYHRRFPDKSVVGSAGALSVRAVCEGPGDCEHELVHVRVFCARHCWFIQRSESH